MAIMRLCNARKWLVVLVASSSEVELKAEHLQKIPEDRDGDHSVEADRLFCV